MAQYEKIDAVRAGMPDGLEHGYESRVAAVAIQFGDPVFYDVGNEKEAFLPDVTDTSLKFGGVAVLSQRSYVDSKGEYPALDMVSVCHEGEIWVRVPDDLTGCANKPALVVAATGNAEYKKFTDTVSAGVTYDSGAVFKGNPVSLGTGLTFARIEVRGLK